MEVSELSFENIILLGFMGSGKSSVGKRLAKSLKWDFIDTDAAIEEISGMSVQEIFRKHGETRFRSEEEVLVKRLQDSRHYVIATGGGTVLNSGNWELLSQIGLMVSLYASLDTILERIGNRNDRPLMKASHEEIERLWVDRQPIYNQADLVIDTTDIGIDDVVREILQKIEGGFENVARG